MLFQDDRYSLFEMIHVFELVSKEFAYKFSKTIEITIPISLILANFGRHILPMHKSCPLYNFLFLLFGELLSHPQIFHNNFAFLPDDYIPRIKIKNSNIYRLYGEEQLY